MISSAVFNRYARSLADVAFEQNEEPAVTSDMAMFGEIFKLVPDMVEALYNPAVPREVKGNLLSSLMAKYPVKRTTANFLRILVDHRRIRNFEEIFNAYVKTVHERKGIVAAQVTAAHVLSEADLAKLRESLSQATGRTVMLDVRTDAELLGGLIVQIGSTVYDGSIRSQLDEMKRKLAEA